MEQTVRKGLREKDYTVPVWLLLSIVGRTWRVHVENGQHVEERWKGRKPQILVTWHGRTLVPMFRFRKRGWRVIMSLSRDGEKTTNLLSRFGWSTVRGSTSRGAVMAAIGAIHRLRAGETLALTPDGPRGPAGIMQPGTAFLAQKAGCPIVPVGVSARPFWRLRSWDSFLVPKPFARVAIVFGAPVYVPKDAPEEERDRLQQHLRHTINDLQRRAGQITGLAHDVPDPTLND